MTKSVEDVASETADKVERALWKAAASVDGPQAAAIMMTMVAGRSVSVAAAALAMAMRDQGIDGRPADYWIREVLRNMQEALDEVQSMPSQ